MARPFGYHWTDEQRANFRAALLRRSEERQAELKAKYKAAARRQGDMLRGVPRPSNQAEANGNWRGDDCTYDAAHLRARRVLAGSVCSDCGQPKFEAALVKGKGTRVSPEGRAYSTNPADYIALCHRCHHRYDHAGRVRNERGQFL